jgi:hypothetical protein
VLMSADDQLLATFGSFFLKLFGGVHLFGGINFGSIAVASSQSNATSATVLTPSSSWNGTLESGFTASAYPPGPTMPVIATASDPGNGEIQLEVASIGDFTNNGIVCAKFLNGTSEANGCWLATPLPYTSCVNADSLNNPCIDFQGSTYVTPFTQAGSPYAVGVANGAQQISGIVANTDPSTDTFAPTCLQVASTANFATGDSYQVFNANGAISADGTWNITVDGGQVCLGTAVAPGPAYVSGYIGGGIVACYEEVIGNIDEHTQVVISADNSEYVTIGAAIGNRQWIDHVSCYYENSTAGTATGQTSNPAYGDDGWVFLLNRPASGLDGNANLTCDVVPTQGLARRIMLNTWLNVPGGSGYTSRPTGFASATLSGANDPTGGSAVAGVYICTDSSGKVISFYSDSGCTTPTTATISTAALFIVCNGVCGNGTDFAGAETMVDRNAYGQASGCTSVSSCTMESSVGVISGTGKRYTTNTGCSSTQGHYYATLRNAVGCAGNSATASVGNGAIICANNGDTSSSWDRRPA